MVHSSNRYTAMKTGGLELHMHQRWISPTCWVKEAIHKGINSAWFHLHKIQKEAKPDHSISNQNSGWFPFGRRQWGTKAGELLGHLSTWWSRALQFIKLYIHILCTFGNACYTWITWLKLFLKVCNPLKIKISAFKKICCLWVGLPPTSVYPKFV